MQHMLLCCRWDRIRNTRRQYIWAAGVNMACRPAFNPPPLIPTPNPPHPPGAQFMNKTKMVCTIGPATASLEALTMLADNGMNM
jgi:hypothetical protein